MTEEDQAEDSSSAGRSRAFTWLVGASALGAWFALLWFMFGDVL